MSSMVPTCHLWLWERGCTERPPVPPGASMATCLPPVRALTRTLEVATLAGVREGTQARGPGWARHTALPAALLGPIGTGCGAGAPGTPF